MVLSLTILIFLSTPVYSAYRKNYEVEVKGNTYILDLKLNIINIGDYGVVSIYLAPEGGYAYGLTILKDPDEKHPHMYVMVGGQKDWFDAGLLNTTVIRFRLIYDYNSSKAVIISYNYNHTFNLSFTPFIKRLYVSVFNLTSRAADYPSIYIEFLKVYVYNETIDKLNKTVYELNKELKGTPVLELRDYGINYQPIMGTNAVSTESNGFDNFILLVMIVAIVAISLVLIILIVNYMGKTRRGSPGP